MFIRLRLASLISVKNIVVEEGRRMKLGSITIGVKETKLAILMDIVVSMGTPFWWGKSEKMCKTLPYVQTLPLRGKDQWQLSIVAHEEPLRDALKCLLRPPGHMLHQKGDGGFWENDERANGTHDACVKQVWPCSLPCLCSHSTRCVRPAFRKDHWRWGVPSGRDIVVPAAEEKWDI